VSSLYRFVTQSANVTLAAPRPKFQLQRLQLEKRKTGLKEASIQLQGNRQNERRYRTSKSPQSSYSIETQDDLWTDTYHVLQEAQRSRAHVSNACTNARLSLRYPSLHTRVCVTRHLNNQAQQSQHIEAKRYPKLRTLWFLSGRLMGVYTEAISGLVDKTEKRKVIF
jgi:hypothetical protein